MGAKIAVISLANLSGRLFKKAIKGSFNKVNGANNKEVGSVESFNAACSVLAWNIRL